MRQASRCCRQYVPGCITRQHVPAAKGTTFSTSTSTSPCSFSSSSSVSPTSPFEWMRDLSSAQTKAYIKAENTHANRILNQPDISRLRMRFLNEMQGIQHSKLSSNNQKDDNDDDDMGVGPEDPEQYGDYVYYSSRHEGEEFPIWYRRRVVHEAEQQRQQQVLHQKRNDEKLGEEEVVIDVSAIPFTTTTTTTTTNGDTGRRHTMQYAAIGSMKISPDPQHRFVAFTVDIDGSERYDLYVRDMDVMQEEKSCVSLTLPSVQERGSRKEQRPQNARAIKASADNKPEKNQEKDQPMYRLLRKNVVNVAWAPYYSTSNLHTSPRSSGGGKDDDVGGGGGGDGLYPPPPLLGAPNTPLISLYYTVAVPGTTRAFQIYRYSSKSTAADYKANGEEEEDNNNEDELIYEEKDESRFVDVALSKDGNLVSATVSDRDSSEVHLLEYRGSYQEERIPTLTGVKETETAPSSHSNPLEPRETRQLYLRQPKQQPKQRRKTDSKSKQLTTTTSISLTTSTVLTTADICLLPRSFNVQYFVEHQQGRFIIVTNAGGAVPDFQVMYANVLETYIAPTTPASLTQKVVSSTSHTSPAIAFADALSPIMNYRKILDTQWKVLFQPEPGCRIEDVDVFSEGKLVVYERFEGMPRIRVIHMSWPELATPYSMNGVCNIKDSSGGSRCKGIDNFTIPPVVAPKSPLPISPTNEDTSISTPFTSMFIPLPANTCGISPGINADPHTKTLRFSVLRTTAPQEEYEYTFATNTLRPAASGTSTHNKNIRGKTQYDDDVSNGTSTTTTTTTSTTIARVPTRPLFVASDYVSYTLHAPSWADASNHSSTRLTSTSKNKEAVVQVPITMVHHVATAGVNPDSMREKEAELWKNASPVDALEQQQQLQHQQQKQHAIDREQKQQSITSSATSLFKTTLQNVFRSSKAFDNSTQHHSLPHAPSTSPTLLHVYGAYGHDLDPSFDPYRLPFLERGWVMAHGHIRGGGEKGNLLWYRTGRAENKYNSLYDAAACAKLLIALGITSPPYLACRTDSAGGIIGGWLANTFGPSLIRAHVLYSPFLDVFGSMMDPHSPLTVAEYPEWGNPGEDENAYKRILSYSPLQNVPSLSNRTTATTGDTIAILPYPHLLLQGAIADPRVPPSHLLRFAAAVRQNLGSPIGNIDKNNTKKGSFRTSAPVSAADNNPMIVCRIQQDAGHFGAGGRSARMQDRAIEAAFLMRSLRQG